MMQWDYLGYVKSSKYRVRIIELLGNAIPMTPKEIRLDLSLHSSHVSRLLSGLTKRRIIKCLNPKSHRGRLFVLTEIGEELHRYLLAKS